MSSTDHLNVDSDISRLESVVCGGVAGLFSRFVISPLDVLKIRLQLDNTRHRNGQSRIYTAVNDILKYEGVTAFWKGNVPAELLYVCYGASQFTTYKIATVACKQNFSGLSEPWMLFFSGSVAGTVATTLTYPFDLLRTRMAAQGAKQNEQLYSSLRDVVKKIYRYEGFTGFFKGLAPSICSITPHNGIFFLSYEKIRQFLHNNQSLDLMPAPEASAGLVAGGLSKSIMFPLDVIRKRLQVQGPFSKQYGLPEYSTRIVKCLGQIVRAEGIRGLYKGYAVALLKGAPTSAVTIWTFEKSVGGLRWLRDKEYIFY